MKLLGLTLALSLLVLVPLACQPNATPITPADEMPQWFADVSREVGLDFVHDSGPPPSDRYFMPQIIGSGAALFDYDGDGLLDIYLVQNAGPSSKSRNRLYHQEKDGTFRDVSKGSGLDVTGYGMGVAIGDVDNDGFPDVLVTEFGGIRLFHNNGDGTFTDITKDSGLLNRQWATSACFVDYDRDGWLDLVVTNYVDYDPTKVCDLAGGRPDYCHPHSFTSETTRLFRNLSGTAKGGIRFQDVTLAAGLGKTPGAGLGVVAADFSGDGWPDILVANDAQPNRLWINQKDGTFRDEAAQRGLAYNAMGQRQGNMGIAIGDIDGRGRFAVFITHLTEETNALYTQEPRGMFRDVTGASGLAQSRWRGTGFGTVFGDFDNDGALDLAVVNGRVSRSRAALDAGVEKELGAVWAPYAERNQLFAGDGVGKFRDVSRAQPVFCGRAGISRGLAIGDFNNDGGLDLLVTTIGGPARLFRNVVAPKRGHWLLVRAIDPALKRDAYGAEISVEANGKSTCSWINPGSSYLCSNDPRAHFGLGDAAKADAIEVRWPDGFNERFAGVAADQVVTLRKGEGKPAAEKSR
jgi:hypothetical protein